MTIDYVLKNIFFINMTTKKTQYINEIIRKILDRKQTLQNDTEISQRNWK